MGECIQHRQVLHQLPNLKEVYLLCTHLEYSEVADLKGLSLDILGLLIGSVSSPSVQLVQNR